MMFQTAGVAMGSLPSNRMLAMFVMAVPMGRLVLGRTPSFT